MRTTEMKKSDTFWEGHRDTDRAKLQKEIPPVGPCNKRKRPMLEEWRKFQNVYYRVYNDGDPFRNRLRHMAKRFDCPLNWKGDLEILGNKVLDAALEEQEKSR
jgi:hypothetical protein